METSLETACKQKLSKISLISSDSNELYREDSMELERTPKTSLNSNQSEIQNLMTIIKLALNSRGVDCDVNINSLHDLKILTTTICTEYLKATQTVKELFLDSKENLEEVPVNFLKPSGRDVIGRIFDMPEQGVKLTREDCQNFAGLLIGAIRDSACIELREKINQMQERIIKFTNNARELRLQIKQKESEIQELQKELEKTRVSNKNLLTSKYSESKRTSNESN
jgi:hypothetical protein